uniref:Very long-chain fatty acid transport protein n=1 Tax=Dendroctonus ponderosae TaxID=77166 RepID=A0AAR5PSH6_DENPD
MLVYVIVSLILVAASLLVRCHRKWLYRVIKTLPRDAKNLHVIFKLSSKLKHWSKQEDTVPTIFTKLAKEHPDKTALIIDGRRWSYQELETFSNRVANFFKSQGYKKGDVVALLMENRPEYLGLWLGLAKIGVITSLINSHLLSTPLTHSILASHNKGLIYGSDFRQVVEDIKEQIQQVVLYEFGGDGDATDLKKQLETSPSSLPEEVFGLRQQDLLFYMYTSGTTGLPKPAKIPHTRFILIATTMNFALDLSPNDVLYSPLPLYHASAGVFSAGQALLFGITFVGRKKFSVSNFWPDCQQYKCTVANYIGEVCRYLLAAHKPGTTVQHNVMKMCGNGLRPQIWQQFKDTFSIGQIYEFYGSTEGNAFLISMDGKLGAVGSVPLWGNWLVSTVLIQCNESTGEPIRNRQGLYSRCKRGEPGLLVGRIVQQGYKSFQGYLDSSATEQKVLRDVLVKGDAYFNTGDILVEDEYGYLYFKDRTGDTFRWKGENVATNEVEAIVSEAIGLKDCMVIGVQVPNTEGRAGMAIIESSEDTIEVQSLAKVLKTKLPSYAIPLFLRTVPTLPKTATQKYKKLEFEKQGFNVTKIPDTSVFVLDLKSLDYVPLTRDMYDDIMLGRIRL